MSGLFLSATLGTLLVGLTWHVPRSIAASPEHSTPIPTFRLPVSPLPIGLESTLPVPAWNPLTTQKIQLGQRLFFDPGLSESGTIACASCHQPEKGFADGRRLPLGEGSRLGRRHTPSLLNSAYADFHAWDGRTRSLEQQSLQPLTNRFEMNNRIETVIATLEANPDYQTLFLDAFASRTVTADRIALALASYQRTLNHADSPYDRFVRFGTDPDFNDSAQRGMRLFAGRAGCANCHEGSLFADRKFHNTGVGWGAIPEDLGRFEVTGDPADAGRFKTPSLRNLILTPPYMHDGSLATLANVIEFYDRGGQRNPLLDPLMRPLNLTQNDKTDLLAFLMALNTSASNVQPEQHDALSRLPGLK